jgi:hypothetical protein
MTRQDTLPAIPAKLAQHLINWSAVIVILALGLVY